MLDRAQNSYNYSAVFILTGRQIRARIFRYYRPLITPGSETGKYGFHSPITLTVPKRSNNGI